MWTEFKGMNQLDFDVSIDLLKNYSFLHDTRNLDFFAEKVFEKIPDDWRRFFFENIHNQTIFFDRSKVISISFLIRLAIHLKNSFLGFSLIKSVFSLTGCKH